MVVEQKEKQGGDGHPEKVKVYTIIVNTREKPWDKKEISYEEVIVLAYGSYSSDENVVYSVTYAKGEGSKHEGSLVKGESVKVKDRMVFNVTRANKS